MQLTGLAQRRVVSRTPTSGVTAVIFLVNFGKYSLARTGEYSVRARLSETLQVPRPVAMHDYVQKKSSPPTMVGTRTT